MKCRNFGFVNEDGEYNPEEFSEWNNHCQNCQFFDECLQKEYFKDKDKEKKHMQKEPKPLGDNFPTYDVIHLRMMLNKERKDMIEKLSFEDLGKITNDDKIDLIIDLECYNLHCRKQLIKERYNKKEKK